MSVWVFDVDGVLVDSRAAVEKAYAEAGVEMPSRAWGKPWGDWLPQACGGDMVIAQKVHARKNEVYSRLLADGDVNILPFAEIAYGLRLANHRVRFVSSGSTDAVKAVMERLAWDWRFVLATEISGNEDRARVLRTVSDTGYYVDDRADARNVTRLAGPGWSFIHAHTEATWML